MARLSVFVLVASVLVAPVQLRAEFAALAYNQNTNNMGFTWGRDTQEYANQRALAACERYSHNVSGCEVVLETKQCFAVFRYKGKDHWAEGASHSKAKRTASAECREKFGAKCWRVTSKCADQ
ncbi:DUF4189 domain-containing protein [Ruegeria halocynthiae]|uniref:DUF4189 domain-containing protein n=1 Tax=Ruegeria halocynthiae TaxID=985054 RepID=UPI001363C8D6|nr:DUF4189 domain-containing protein [Ruegeria halocynthiae]